MAKLTEEELRKIALGYNWNPDISYEDFVKNNSHLTENTSYNIWNMIEKRYIEHLYS